ncbi:MAG: hypothetical protein JXN65_01890 [Clostridia bacterium]|nr:hypothetical protein [Clostridia bacterium]
MYCRDEFEERKSNLDPENSKSAIFTLVSLIEKLEQRGIKDGELDQMFSRLDTALTDYENPGPDRRKKKALYKEFNSIVDYAYKRHNMVQRGTFFGIYMVIFMGSGIALGVALSNSGVVFSVIIIMIGAVLGMAIGTAMEKKAKKEGRLY